MNVSSFDVRHKEHKKIRHAFAVRVLDNGITQFLTYDFDKWIWLPLNDYQPIDYPID